MASSSDKADAVTAAAAAACVKSELHIRRTGRPAPTPILDMSTATHENFYEGEHDYRFSYPAYGDIMGDEPSASRRPTLVVWDSVGIEGNRRWICYPGQKPWISSLANWEMPATQNCNQEFAKVVVPEADRRVFSRQGAVDANGEEFNVRANYSLHANPVQTRYNVDAEPFFPRDEQMGKIFLFFPENVQNN